MIILDDSHFEMSRVVRCSLDGKYDPKSSEGTIEMTREDIKRTIGGSHATRFT
jgi:hypothetical protein